MKKITLLFAAIPFLGLAQNEKPASVSGTLSNVKGNIGMVYVYYAANGKRVTDSSVVTNNKYAFTVQLGEPTLATIVAKDADAPKGTRTGKKDVLPAFLEPGTITIVSTDSFSNAKITGSKAQIEYEKIKAASKPYEAQMEVLSTKYSDQRKANDVEGAKKTETELDALDDKMRADVYGGYLTKNPTSIIGLYALQQYGGYELDADKVEPFFNKLSAEQQNSASGIAYKGRIETAKTLGIGKIAPEFSQNDTLGNTVALSSLRGKYLLVDFWASWCGPCRRENPNVVKAFNKFKDKGFTVLGISLDQPGAKDNWMKAIHDDGLTWNHVSDLQFWNNAVAKQYGIQAIPQNLLLDPQGKIVAKNLHGEELEAKLATLLN